MIYLDGDGWQILMRIRMGIDGGGGDGGDGGGGDGGDISSKCTWAGS